MLAYSRGGPKVLNRSLDVLIYTTKTLLLKYTEIKKMITSVATNYFCRIKMHLGGKTKNERMLPMIWMATALE